MYVERPTRRKSEAKQCRCNKMDLHQLHGSLYSSPQLYSILAWWLGQDPFSCSADDKMIEKLVCIPYQIGRNYTPLSLSSTWALASNICLKDPSTCSCYHFLYIYTMQPFSAPEGAKFPRSDIFLTEMFDLQRPTNQNNHRLHIILYNR